MSSGFVTETELAEIRKKRQEEWERVRKPEDPIERPEEPIDCRSLYDRLQEQKQKRDLEYEEAHKLKNMIKGLDDDEIEFLDFVDRTKLAADRKKLLEERKELDDYRNRVAQLPDRSIEEKLEMSSRKRPSSRSEGSSNQKRSQVTLLKGVVVKKGKKRKSVGDEREEGDREKVIEKIGKEEGVEGKGVDEKPVNVGLTCIGILPGLGHYSETSSDSDQEIENPKLDLLGRKIEDRKKQAGDNCS